jgi:hypothetical protein
MYYYVPLSTFFFSHFIPNENILNLLCNFLYFNSIQLTDAAIRSIGNNCHSLKSLDISHAQLVSDVGIAQVAFGCPDLKTIKCNGLFYLSDPRIPPPKKGSKLEAWEAVVGIKLCIFIIYY